MINWQNILFFRILRIFWPKKWGCPDVPDIPRNYTPEDLVVFCFANFKFVRDASENHICIFQDIVKTDLIFILLLF